MNNVRSYFPQEIKAANKEILPLLGDLKPLTENINEEVDGYPAGI